jgi:hypothetical protein
MFSLCLFVAARLDKLEADDPALIEYIRKNKMAPPPAANALTKAPPSDTSQHHQTPMLLEMLKNKVTISLPEHNFCSNLVSILYCRPTDFSLNVEPLTV